MVDRYRREESTLWAGGAIVFVASEMAAQWAIGMMSRRIKQYRSKYKKDGMNDKSEEWRERSRQKGP